MDPRWLSVGEESPGWTRADSAPTDVYDGWTLVRHAGEAVSLGSWHTLATSLDKLPPHARVVEVLRVERGPVVRAQRVVRAFRGLRGLPDLAGAWRPEPGMLAGGFVLELVRSRFTDAIGLAEAAQGRGDWSDALSRWSAIADARDDAWGAYAHVRAALVLESAGADRKLGDRWNAAIANDPTLPEAWVGLARWTLRARGLEPALRVAQMATSIRSPAVEVPHPWGIQRGWAAAELSRVFARADASVAADLAELATHLGFNDGPDALPPRPAGAPAPDVTGVS